MKAVYHLTLAVFSVGAVAAPTTVPNATDPVAASVFQAHIIPDAVRNVVAELSARLGADYDGSAAESIKQKIAVGESLSGSVELYPISKHETYRYAVIGGHRLIVDAASRKIVYVIQ